MAYGSSTLLLGEDKKNQKNQKNQINQAINMIAIKTGYFDE